jgi:hypothetical protein
MPSLYMGTATYRFEVVVVERVVPPDEPGNFALGFKDESDEFVPKYIGRSDSNLRQELLKRSGEKKYPFFKFAPGGPRSAYDMECAHYHSYKDQLDSPAHPTRPEGSELTCFLCGQ